MHLSTATDSLFICSVLDLLPSFHSIFKYHSPPNCLLWFPSTLKICFCIRTYNAIRCHIKSSMVCCWIYKTKVVWDKISFLLKKQVHSPIQISFILILEDPHKHCELVLLIVFKSLNSLTQLIEASITLPKTTEQEPIQSTVKQTSASHLPCRAIQFSTLLLISAPFQ